ncbi:MAG: RNB domain-containing ribonuclease [Bacteroidales bacterium]
MRDLTPRHDHQAMLRAIARRAMVEHRLAPDFTPASLAELSRLAPAVNGGGRDLRSLPWCSIDNDDSLDLDQLTVSLDAGVAGTRVLVAVADVEGLVSKDGALDAHARQNTTSVYTPAQIFPMLPEKLSTDLTSLAFNEDRTAIVIDMTVAPDGTIGASDIYPAVVRNQAKLAYDSVAAWLDGQAPHPWQGNGAGTVRPPADGVADVVEAQLRVQDRAAQALHQWRHEHGALDFETIEARAVFADRSVSGLKVERRNRAKELIENFMVAANGVTARYLAAHKVASIRRVVRTPARWDRIVELAARYGEALPATPDGLALQEFLVRRRAADPTRFADVSLAVIKLLGPGEYVVERPGDAGVGHFGLAARDYAHSTAPNRRFPDLVTQRLLKSVLLSTPLPYGDDELELMATHCTEMEDEATKVERLVRKAAAALLLESRIGDQFDAVVTGASPKGTWVRLFDPPVEGRVVRGYDGLDVGDQVRVRLISTDAERGFIDFSKA